MKSEPKKKLPNKKVIRSAKFEAKEQFTKSALENLKTLIMIIRILGIVLILGTVAYYGLVLTGQSNL